MTSIFLRADDDDQFVDCNIKDIGSLKELVMRLTGGLIATEADQVKTCRTRLDVIWSDPEGGLLDVPRSNLLVSRLHYSENNYSDSFQFAFEGVVGDGRVFETLFVNVDALNGVNDIITDVFPKKDYKAECQEDGCNGEVELQARFLFNSSTNRFDITEAYEHICDTCGTSSWGEYDLKPRGDK